MNKSSARRRYATSLLGHRKSAPRGSCIAQKEQHSLRRRTIAASLGVPLTTTEGRAPHSGGATRSTRKVTHWKALALCACCVLCVLIAALAYQWH